MPDEKGIIDFPSPVIPIETRVRERGKKKEMVVKPVIAKGRKAVKNIAGQQVIGFKFRTVVFPSNQRVEITDEEFESPIFQSKISKFKEVK